MKVSASWYCFKGILIREFLRFVQQRSRFLSALIRPLLWLVVFAAGFRAALGIAIIDPYETYITYETYIAPGLCCMIYLLLCKMVSTALISLTQVYAFLLIALLVDVEPPLLGYLTVLPALLLVALLLSSLGLFLSTRIRQLENFAGVMNFVIFPMFFLSSALYPLWKMQEASEWLYWICAVNPFTHAVELVRYALYLKLNTDAMFITAGCTLFFAVLAVTGFNPQKSGK